MSLQIFTERDLAQMAELGIPPEEALRQIDLFRNPPAFTRVLRPCRLGDGILRLSESEQRERAARFDQALQSGRAGAVGRLVPASGAASRMFKSLLAYLSDGKPSADVSTFFEQLPRFAFYGDLASELQRGGHDLNELVRRGSPEDLRLVLEYFLTGVGLGYSELPKGLLAFHRYPMSARTPFEEHLVEAAAHLRDGQGVCRLHFTVSPDDEARFRELLAEVGPGYEQQLGTRFEVTFSFQKRSTDTLAVDPENNPFRDDDGSLLFRPGGHGALIDNLDTLGRQGWSVALLKNIDNIMPEERQGLVVYWKRVLGGVLLDFQERVFGYLERLEDESGTAVLDEAARFLERELSRPLPDGLAASEAGPRRRWLIEALDRPLRACGMVPAIGDPGGGPFWVAGSEPGQVSIQIVETSQIDPKNEEQQAHLKSATHFNPVDLACALHDRHGRPYDLHQFVDPATVFIANKSHEGRPLKALERPGLWNGAMAGWNSVFVEVPAETFAPVKTVLDLLRPEHQTGG